MAKPIDKEELKDELTPEQYEKYLKALKTNDMEEVAAALPYLGLEYMEQTIYCPLNRRIREIRKENGLTQTELANVLSISQKEYWRYEQEGYSPHFFKLAHLAMFYNVSLDWFSGFNEEKKPFIPNTPIYEANIINGYSLKDMKAAKARGEKYKPLKEEWEQDNEESGEVEEAVKSEEETN